MQGDNASDPLGGNMEEPQRFGAWDFSPDSARFVHLKALAHAKLAGLRILNTPADVLSAGE